MQTAVSMYIVLGNKVKGRMDEEALEGWISAYIGERVRENWLHVYG